MLRAQCDCSTRDESQFVWSKPIKELLKLNLCFLFREKRSVSLYYLQTQAPVSPGEGTRDYGYWRVPAWPVDSCGPWPASWLGLSDCWYGLRIWAPWFAQTLRDVRERPLWFVKPHRKYTTLHHFYLLTPLAFELDQEIPCNLNESSWSVEANSVIQTITVIRV